jgi:hypothetical protein
MIRGIESERGGGAGVCGVLAVPTDRGRVFQWNAQCEIKKCTKNQKPKTCFTGSSQQPQRHSHKEPHLIHRTLSDTLKPRTEYTVEASKGRGDMIILACALLAITLALIWICGF